MGSDGWMTMQAAWHAALYGARGFYRHQQPAEHFRTSAHVSADFATTFLAIAREQGVETVVDVGAGAGELLSALRERDGALRLAGIELRPRPPSLPPGIEWLQLDLDPRTSDSATNAVAAVATHRTLLLANELLDNVAAPVVELAPDGLREVEVHRATGRERLGGPPDPGSAAWIARWWPLADVGQRAVVGLARDAEWARLCSAVPDGLCVTVDFGHTVADRPGSETPSSYRRGRQRSAVFDGLDDITSGVAVDSVAFAVGGRLERQRDVLERRLPAPERPSIELARTDPVGYLRRLSATGDWRELTERRGLGDFWWVVSEAGGRRAAESMSVVSQVSP